MSQQRFFIKGLDQFSGQVVFPENISHQIKHVLRLKVGENVVVLDGVGKEYQVELLELEGKKISGKIREISGVKSNLNISLHLFFPMTKRDKLEWILQKCTEVGVSAFHPFVSRRSLVQSSQLKGNKRERWEAIIREAAEQSGRIRLPVLYDPVQLSLAVNALSSKFDAAIAGWVNEEKRSIKDALGKLSGEIVEKNSAPNFGLFIGPEGGFDEGEIESLRENGVLTVSLGARILRMETAALVISSLVLYEFNAYSFLE
jgi:16S rRNA (uracil1498-N3)-methyltransferase